MRKFPISIFLAVLLLSGCQSAPTVEQEPTQVRERWQTLGQFSVQSLNLLVGFNNEMLGISVGDDGHIVYTADGGMTWLPADNQSMGLYGLDIVDNQTAFACGTNRHVRNTVDGGATWQVKADFGAGFPNHCRFVSFYDYQNGWVATPSQLGITGDGGASWSEAKLPDGIENIAAVSLFAAGQGYLLDTAGKLYLSRDNAQSWVLAGELTLGDIKISTLSYPTAAMRFQNADRGMVVISAIINGAGQVSAFFTTDGGKTWTQEVVMATFGALYLSRDGHYLTLLLPPYTVTLLKYNGD